MKLKHNNKHISVILDEPDIVLETPYKETMCILQVHMVKSKKE